MNGSVMSKEICLVFTASVQPENWSAFERLVSKVVEATSREAGAMGYQYSATEDRGIVHIVERYRDSAAFMFHTEKTFAGYAKEFLELASLDALSVHGNPSAECREVLDKFNAVYLDVFAGFSR
jgi:quinol monooxygenase YgiN